ncbi:hypothetical protein ACFC26_34590 [Kitasatospora purpeofusca]|uniref:hypothetical protein n=1 Tax=Kitasatospora purpeofusca TaxID=67352 RepID=UPI0035DD1CE1
MEAQAAADAANSAAAGSAASEADEAEGIRDADEARLRAAVPASQAALDAHCPKAGPGAPIPLAAATTAAADAVLAKDVAFAALRAPDSAAAVGAADVAETTAVASAIAVTR